MGQCRHNKIHNECSVCSTNLDGQDQDLPPWTLGAGVIVGLFITVLFLSVEKTDSQNGLARERHENVQRSLASTEELQEEWVDHYEKKEPIQKNKHIKSKPQSAPSLELNNGRAF